ncbi:MAG: glycosyl hydrolase, partial [Treponema sp.]|nr:glycosyl hydrolase [Treponema sp.]
AYVVGYLRAKVTDDLLNPKSWKKEPTAMLHLMSVKNRLGPGHNSFFKDENGKLMIAYHAQEREKYNCRCSAYHRVHISKSGLPLLNVSDERDLPDCMQNVKLVFKIGK